MGEIEESIWDDYRGRYNIAKGDGAENQEKATSPSLQRLSDKYKKNKKREKRETRDDQQLKPILVGRQFGAIDILPPCISSSGSGWIYTLCVCVCGGRFYSI